MMRPGRGRTERTLRLQAADSFDLIRWLARSQADPRKAAAELVQNSLDAGARHVWVERVRERGAVCLVVRDDGEGVLPGMEREEALAYLATHVGHSRKLGIDPAERTRRVIAGQYGVGLLGFWAIGRRLELRSRVGGSDLVALRLEEDSPEAAIVRLPPRTDDPETFTEAAVTGVHVTAQKVLGGRRLTDYLAAELREQILRSGVDIRVHGGLARGTAQERFRVTPPRFTGERLDVPAEVEVPGYPPLRVELYLARGAAQPAIQVAAAGTLVADDAADLCGGEMARAPWVGRDLVGLFDFAGFRVAPGTRRGVVPDAAAEAFLAAVERLRPRVEAELERLEAERQASLDRGVVRELRRALRGLRRRLPQYDLPRVAGEPEPDGSATRGAALADGEGPAAAERPEADEAPLFPPGPLAEVRIAPEQVRVAPGGERRVRAVAVDADGRPCADAAFRWNVEPADAGVAVRGEGARPAVTAEPLAAEGTAVRLRVEARREGRKATAAAAVLVCDFEGEEGGWGIPEPRLVSDAEGAWRSRMVGERWEVNDAHEDYRALRSDPRKRVRYLLALLAKEIALRTSGRPDTAPLLESVVEILAHAERNLRGGLRSGSGVGIPPLRPWHTLRRAEEML